MWGCTHYVCGDGDSARTGIVAAASGSVLAGAVAARAVRLCQDLDAIRDAHLDAGRLGVRGLLRYHWVLFQEREGAHVASRARVHGRHGLVDRRATPIGHEPVVVKNPF